MRARAVAIWSCFVLALSGCGAAASTSPRAAIAAAPASTAPQAAPAAASADPFAEALAEMGERDAGGNWDDAACTGVANRLASATDPPSAPALYDAAVAESRCDHFAAAISYAERAILADLDSARARVLRAHLEAMRAIQQGDLTGASAVLGRAAERDPMDGVLLADLAHVRVAAVLAAKRPGSAELDLAAKACDAAVLAAPLSARPYALRAALAAREGRIADARADLDRATALDPRSTGIQLDAAVLAEAVHDFAAADARYLAVIGASDDTFDVRLRRALALRKRLDAAPAASFEELYRAARDALASAIAVAPDRPEAHLEFAFLLWQYRAPRETSALFLALEIVRQVLAESAGRPDLRALHARAADMKTEIEGPVICAFPRATEAERKRQEAEAKQRAAEAEAYGSDDEPVSP